MVLCPVEGAIAKAFGLDAATRLRRLRLFRRALADTAGLPRRPWFEHLLYAPGFYTGYGVKTMPGILEAVEQHQPAEAQAEAARVTTAILRMAAAVDRAAQELSAALH